MLENKSLIWDEYFPSLVLKGEGTPAFLHGQTTADFLDKKKLEKISMSCWLSTKGCVKALLEVRLSNDMAKIAIISGDINAIRDGFESVIFPADKVKLEVAKPIRRIQKINNFTSWKMSEFEWIEENDLIVNEFSSYTKITKEELEIWKIIQGIPVFDREINGETNPYELGLVDTINLDKGCYLGQEAIARLFRSKSLKYQLRYWDAYKVSNDLDIGKKLLNMNQEEGVKKTVGVITSSVRVDENCFKGLALIKTNFLDKEFCFSENGHCIAIKKPISFTQPY